jgi:AraC-like DNA-binding protein
MKPQLLKISNPPDSSINYFWWDTPYFPAPWHYHPEYEIVLMLESTGKKFVGSSITDFQPGDLCMIGSFLPHYYKSDAQYYDNNPDLRARSVVVHFVEDFMGEQFLKLPESQAIKSLLERSRRGLQFGEKTVKKISEKLKNIKDLQGMPKLLELVSILHIMAEATDITYLTVNPLYLKNDNDSARMQKVMEFVMANYQEEITLQKVADLASMSESAFSRYFKKRTRRTFTQFLAEIRIEHSCKLLMQDKMSVAEISFESGFNNLSNFNRQFKTFKKMTPLVYRMKFLK